jgi:serine/threonine protein kinase
LSEQDSDAQQALVDFWKLELPSSQWTVEREIGKGAFGTVNIGTAMRSNQVEQASTHCKTAALSDLPQVAIKTLHASGSVELHARFLLEAQLLYSHRHPHIIEIRAISVSPVRYAMEYMRNGLIPFSSY